MIITSEKIEVTEDMLTSAGMTRMTLSGMQIGVPVKHPCAKSLSLSWKDMIELTNEDFDRIEQYFISNQCKLTHCFQS